MRKRHALLLTLAAALLSTPCSSQAAKRGGTPQEKSTTQHEDRIDLNHATLEQLMTVPGLTRTWAERIIRFRPYRTKQDLIDEGVLPGDVYNRIRDYVIAHRDKS